MVMLHNVIELNQIHQTSEERQNHGLQYGHMLKGHRVS